jgi:hypothetical protein
MAHPIITQKTTENLTISDQANKLFQVIYQEKNRPVKDLEDIPKLKVSNLISKMSFYYEKIRNVVDYKEEHLLRKNAIERILKRQIMIEAALKTVKSTEVARHLLTELIRAGYLPNNKIPEYRVDEIAKVIGKYLILKKYAFAHHKEETGKGDDCVSWVIALCASDLEERLGNNPMNELVVKNMYEILKDNILLPDGSPYESEKEIQLYLGIHRSYLKFDRDMLSFLAVKYYVPEWSAATGEEIDRIGRNLGVIKKAVDAQLNHALARQLDRIISRYTVFFRILTDVIDEDPVGVYKNFKVDPKAFPRQIKQKCELRYRQAKKKLWRAAVRSIFYIFITKSIFAVILEVPVIKWFGENINLLSLVINVSFPAILLFLIVFFSKLPGEDNSKRVVAGVEEIVFNERRRAEPFQLYTPVKRSKFKNTVFGFIYAATFLVSFGFVVWALDQIAFNWVSIVIFLFFLALVSFFSSRIRKGTKEMIIVEPKENILTLFSDFFYTPVVSAGKWLSENFARINVFVFVLDFIIEAPFKIFVEIAEEWTRYVRERKDEIL